MEHHSTDFDLIHAEVARVESALKLQLIWSLIPDLKSALDRAAAIVVDELNPDSPFAADVARAALLDGLIEFLMLSEVSEPEQCTRVHQLTPQHALYYLD
jgi:hypothetical protein